MKISQIVRNFTSQNEAANHPLPLLIVICRQKSTFLRQSLHVVRSIRKPLNPLGSPFLVLCLTQRTNKFFLCSASSFVRRLYWWRPAFFSLVTLCPHHGLRKGWPEAPSEPAYSAHRAGSFSYLGFLNPFSVFKELWNANLFGTIISYPPI